MPRPKVIGQRTRFPGFVLTDAPRDRAVADWIDEQPNASEAIKQLIYQVKTGQFNPGNAVKAAKPQAARQRQDERQEALPSAFTAMEDGEDIPDVNTEDPDAEALFGAFGD